SIKETDFRILVSIVSKGTIIPISEREKLFEAFMRGSNSQNKSGSGLGLRIVKRILEYHKAEISYNSTSENENLFTVIFNK
ncbi:MAG: sensor histidine kinase, partial [Chryseobacterium sp.]|nr:sensor histidine kinase [Chryseobacterium sp.]